MLGSAKWNYDLRGGKGNNGHLGTLGGKNKRLGRGGTGGLKGTTGLNEGGLGSRPKRRSSCRNKRRRGGRRRERSPLNHRPLSPRQRRRHSHPRKCRSGHHNESRQLLPHRRRPSPQRQSQRQRLPLLERLLDPEPLNLKHPLLKLELLDDNPLLQCLLLRSKLLGVRESRSYERCRWLCCRIQEKYE